MPYSKDDARAHIAALVKQFRADEAALLHAAEAQIEDVYLKPLFRYLNWNVTNSGLARAEWEFVVQATTEKGKRPDYILQLAGQQLLVMDAKQIKYSMHDPRWINQVYAYAYSTQNYPPPRKIDFAILTDFQEFILLDCTLYAADPKAVHNFRVLDWTCDDYVTQFETLWELFERNNVEAAARTRTGESPSGLWARYLSPKKVKANRLPPDKAFLSQMDDEKTGWRVRLAKDMKKRNPDADGSLITAAVQLLIDRLIFVKALSDREIEDDYLAQLAETVERAGLAESDTGWFSACRAIFDKLNQFYNGSIFERRPELESVTVSNKTVREVIRDLQPENSPYNFAVLPVEILGTIYERFLGRVVRATEKQVKIEEKPEVRKAGGVYYTPQYIVDYIVQNTVGKLLADCGTPDEAAQLKILDPACGSGSFLLGAYAALIAWHENYYRDRVETFRGNVSPDRETPPQETPHRGVSTVKRDRENFYIDSEGAVRLTAKRKRQILLNNLFGVDIDAQAVEVTRFSLSLKALADTRRDELNEEVTLFKQTVLPDLSANIKCGNSLIGPDYFAGQMFADADELRRVNPFEWAREFPQVFSQGAATPDRFPKNLSGVAADGFDAVIGNPPYIRIQTLKEWAPLEVEIYKEAYTAASAGNYDIYVVFVEKGLSLLNERGRLGFILPHKFFNAQYGEALRGLIVEGRHLGHIVHFGDQQVFDGATTYTALMFLDKRGNDSFELVRVSDLESWQAGEPQTRGEVKAEAATAAEWNFAVGKGAGLFERLSQMPVKLGDIAERMAQGIRTSANEIYVLNLTSEGSNVITAHSEQLAREVKLERKAVSLFLQGREIKSYRILSSGKVVIIPYKFENGRTGLIAERELKEQLPRTYAYLSENKKFLENREHGKMRGERWYAYIYPKNIEVMSSPKILVPDIADRASFALDEKGEFAFTSGYGIVLKRDTQESMKYILGLLNSKVVTFYLKQITTPLQNGFFRYFTQFIEPLPIRRINFSDPADKARHDRMVKLVESMLALHQQKAAAKTQSDQTLFQRQIEATDRQIEALVYELYGLTEEEVRVVEGR